MAVRLAFDTNRYADLCRGNPRAVEIVQAADSIWLPFVVVGELRAGFTVGSQRPRNEAVLRRFLLKPGTRGLCARVPFHSAAYSRRRRGVGPSQALLPPPQSQQLRVDGEDLEHGLFKLPTRLDLAPHSFDPFVGDE